MIPFTIAQIADIVGGRLDNVPDPDVRVTVAV